MTTKFTAKLRLARIFKYGIAIIGAIGAQFLANTCSAGTVSGLTISDLSVPTPFVDSPTTGVKLETISSATIVASNLVAPSPSFTARFAGLAAADTELPAQTQSAVLLLTGFVSFNITALPTETWSINVAQTRNFALTLVADPPTNGFQSQAFTDLGSASFNIAPGPTGSLQFPSAPVEDTTGTFGNIDLPINKSVTDVLTGAGSANVQFSIFERLVANSFANNNPNATALAPGQEAAVRFGMLGSLTNVSADDYPGPGGRSAAADGHFFDVRVSFSVPEPSSVALAALGLATVGGLATRCRRHFTSRC
jgi:hypothetical protein